MEEFAYAREEKDQVGGLEGLPRAVPGAVDRLVEPYAHVCGAERRDGEGESAVSGWEDAVTQII